MNNSTGVEDVKAFFEGWALYETIIQHNYMIHAEAIELIAAQLQAMNRPELRCLEVGCGDAHTMSHVAQQVDIAHYTGIDLSEMAQQFARRNLQPVVEDVLLMNGDMTERLPELSGKFDVVVAGHALHHLQHAAKARMFDAFAERLSPGGVVMIYDFVMPEHERRIAFLERALNHFDTNWRKLDDKQLGFVRTHVLASDFPEAWAGWNSLARSAGLTKSSLPFADDNQIFGLMTFAVQTGRAGSDKHDVAQS